MRTGLGFDAHAFDASRPLVLGGMLIPDTPGLAGHSDADVLVHAVVDALLGAARLGDIGERFPSDDEWRDAPSTKMLSEVASLLARAGWQISNVDATVIGEHPRLSPHRDRMAAHVASALHVEAERVSVKATTTDGLGFTGRNEGMAAVAVVLLTGPGEPRG